MKLHKLIPFQRTIQDTRRQTQKSTRNILAGLSVYRQLFGQAQARQDQGAAKIKTFDNILAAWELTREEIPTAKKSLRIEICTWIATACLMLIGATTTSSGWVILQLATVAFVCLFAVTARVWKYRILDQEQFVPFKYWIIGKKTNEGGEK